MTMSSEHDPSSDREIGEVLLGAPERSGRSLSVCLNLDRRPDRWRAFRAQLPFRHARRLPAVDGSMTAVPPWWAKGAGAWGCYRTHVHALEQALMLGLADRDGTIVVFEDDAYPCDGFDDRLADFALELPADWQMVYLGGQARAGFDQISERVNRLNGSVRTHAYALRGTAIRTAYHYLVSAFVGDDASAHVDALYERMVQQGALSAHGPNPWLVGQLASFSDVSRCPFPTRWWGEGKRREWVGPVWITGEPDSGSGAIAAGLHHLGLHLGRNATDHANPNLAFVAPVINSLLDTSAASGCAPRSTIGKRATQRLRRWTNRREREARFQRAIFGAHSPDLLRIVNSLEGAASKSRYVVTYRSSQLSRDSLPPRFQRKLGTARTDAPNSAQGDPLDDSPERDLLATSLHQLQHNPEDSLRRIADFIGLPTRPENIKDAARIAKARMPKEQASSGWEANP